MVNSGIWKIDQIAAQNKTLFSSPLSCPLLSSHPASHVSSFPLFQSPPRIALTVKCVNALGFLSTTLVGGWACWFLCRGGLQMLWNCLFVHTCGRQFCYMFCECCDICLFDTARSDNFVTMSVQFLKNNLPSKQQKIQKSTGDKFHLRDWRNLTVGCTCWLSDILHPMITGSLK